MQDVHDEAYVKTYTLRGGHVGSLWMGLQIPNNDTVADGDVVAGEIAITADGFDEPLIVNINVNVDGDQVSDNGDSDIRKSFSRLRWLDSHIGIDESVSAPFTILDVVKNEENSLEIGALLKKITINELGFVKKATIDHTTSRKGEDVLTQYDLLNPVVLVAVDEDNNDVVMTRNSSTLQITFQSDAKVEWKTELISADGLLSANVVGSIEYDSYCRYSVTLNGDNVALNDVQLRWKNDGHAKMMEGMGSFAVKADDLEWKWNNNSGTNSLWLGRAEAGLMVKLRGPEP